RRRAAIPRRHRTRLPGTRPRPVPLVADQVSRRCDQPPLKRSYSLASRLRDGLGRNSLSSESQTRTSPMQESKRDRVTSSDMNLDPITGEPGAHPVGTGIGAATGGAATGAAAGSVAGPVGTVVGAVAGGIVGGLAGHSIAEAIDPTAEQAYW